MYVLSYYGVLEELTTVWHSEWPWSPLQATAANHSHQLTFSDRWGGHHRAN